MVNEKVQSNRRIAWLIAPEATIADFQNPSRANLLALVNMSAGIRIGGTDFGLQATQLTDDRSFADEAGAQELGYAAFGGNISTFWPDPRDTTSVDRVAHDTFKNEHTRLAAAQRFGPIESIPLASGDEINLFRVITDAEIPERRQTGYSTTTELVAQDDVLVNFVVPGAAPVAVLVGGTSGGTVASGGGFLWATYQGVKVTAGVTWVSSDPTTVEVLPHGYARFLKAGTASITATYPGATASTAKMITVTA